MFSRRESESGLLLTLDPAGQNPRKKSSQIDAVWLTRTWLYGHLSFVQEPRRKNEQTGI